MRPVLPLILTIFRLFLGPVFLWAHAQAQPSALLMLAIVGASMLTDWLDGMLARRWKVVSVTGKLLDPFADALFCMIVFWAFARHGLMPMWIVVLLIAREAFMTFLLRPVALWRGIVVAAGPLGKIKTVIQFTAIVIVILRLSPLGAQVTLFTVLAPVAFALMLAFSLVSAGQYAIGVARALLHPQHVAPQGATDKKSGTA